MTLKEWSDKEGILPTEPTTEKGAVSVLVNFYAHGAEGCPALKELGSLTDYVISYQKGTLVWLTPKKKRVKSTVLVHLNVEVEHDEGVEPDESFFEQCITSRGSMTFNDVAVVLAEAIKSVPVA